MLGGRKRIAPHASSRPHSGSEIEMEEKALFDQEIMNFMIKLRKKIRENPQAFKGEEIRKIALKKFPDMHGHEDLLWAHWVFSRKDILEMMRDYKRCHALRMKDKTLREISEETGLPLSHVHRILKTSNKKKFYGTHRDAAYWLGFSVRTSKRVKENVEHDALLKSCFTWRDILTLILVVK